MTLYNRVDRHLYSTIYTERTHHNRRVLFYASYSLCRLNIAVSLLHIVSMYTCALRRRQIVNAPPAHLQEHKVHDEYPHSHLQIALLAQAVVNIGKISQPGGSCLGFFRVPSPVVSPGIFCPERTRKHAQRQECPANVDKVVRNVKFFMRNYLALLKEQQIDSHDKSCS